MSVDFMDFSGAHKNRSSDIFVMPEFGLLLKVRPDRSEASLVNEYRNLLAWSMLLNHYHPEKGDEFGALASPYPVQIDIARRGIVMSFCPGIPIVSVITGNYGFPEASMPTADVVAGVSYGLGRLAAIKTREQLLHGDYHWRHVLFNPMTIPTPEGRMSVIDVESSRTESGERLATEHDRMHQWLMTAVGRRKQQYVENSFNDGLGSLEPGEPVWGDALHVADDEIA